ncbi:acyl-CoA dehydrogenase family protein [Microbacterium sp. A84]|uniref:acyl-CoA dehydrogenase family protein n=1 Tax=Microbacterium sp. A84 TaxID=3450715 RepID=UPI003F437B86
MTNAPPELAEAYGPGTTPEEAGLAAREWLRAALPEAWREAGERGGPAAVRQLRTPDEYRAWYPKFSSSGLVAPTWAVEHGGLGWSTAAARSAERELAPYHLPRLNPLGLNLAAPALFAYGSEDQRRRFLPPIVQASEVWCQLFSEPGAGSDLASLSTRAERDGDDWVITGQKIWTTWADQADFAILLARTDPDAPKHQGITYFLIDMHQDAVEARPLRHMGGETEFFQVFIDGARVPDSQRVGEIGNGWRVAQATLGGERQMVAGTGSGGVDRVGGGSALNLVRLARRRDEKGLSGGWQDPVVRSSIVRLWCEERTRQWTNQRVRELLAQKVSPGPESSIGKVHGSDLNQRIQGAAAGLLGMNGLAWAGLPDVDADYAETMPREVMGMLRSRANTIEGGTSEVNKNVLAERVLGLPKEPDLFKGMPWRDLPRG